MRGNETTQRAMMMGKTQVGTWGLRHLQCLGMPLYLTEVVQSCSFQIEVSEVPPISIRVL